MKNKKTTITLIVGMILAITIISAIVSHNSNQIWVSVGGDEMTLQEAIDTIGLCTISSTTTYLNNKPNPGHYASEMELSSGKSLQKSIDDGDFCGASSTYCDSRNCGSDTCGGYCGPYYNSCPVAGQVCTNGNCVTPCVPATSCSGLCGTQDNGCGGTYYCGSCVCGGTIHNNPIKGGRYLYAPYSPPIASDTCNKWCTEQACVSGTFLTRNSGGSDVAVTWWTGVEWLTGNGELYQTECKCN